MKCEQIVTIKVTYDDGSADICSNEENCCGEGQCENRVPAPSDNDIACCVPHERVEILQASPVRPVDPAEELML